MKSFTKIRMIRLPKRWTIEYYNTETFGKDNWNTWTIGDVGYIEGITTINSQVVLVIVLGNKIINCFPSAVEVIKDQSSII
jgi:hypothetical protein